MSEELRNQTGGRRPGGVAVDIPCPHCGGAATFSTGEESDPVDPNLDMWVDLYCEGCGLERAGCLEPTGVPINPFALIFGGPPGTGSWRLPHKLAAQFHASSKEILKPGEAPIGKGLRAVEEEIQLRNLMMQLEEAWGRYSACAEDEARESCES